MMNPVFVLTWQAAVPRRFFPTGCQTLTSRDRISGNCSDTLRFSSPKVRFERRHTMLKKLALVAALTITPAVAFAQSQPSGGAVGGATSGAAAGAVGGAVVGGPVGAVVGGVGGAVVGAIVGDAAEPKFRTYVVQQRVPSYTYAEPVAVGTVLPQQGVVYHQLPADYAPNASNYRYTVVNDRTVIVEPQTRRIVQIIE
jgi:hypothetical protein